jgi:hypothetical protein
VLDEDMLRHYVAALDEIYRLRVALATEARITKAHLLLKTFPASRRTIAEEQVERMERAARGETADAYPCSPFRVDKEMLRLAGAPTTLTRAAWEEQR